MLISASIAAGLSAGSLASLGTAGYKFAKDKPYQASGLVAGGLALGGAAGTATVLLLEAPLLVGVGVGVGTAMAGGLLCEGVRRYCKAAKAETEATKKEIKEDVKDAIAKVENGVNNAAEALITVSKNEFDEQGKRIAKLDNMMSIMICNSNSITAAQEKQDGKIEEMMETIGQLKQVA